MRTVTLKSSALKSASHTGSTLTVEHTDGSTYDYRDVPADVLDALAEAQSVGRFYNSSVRNTYTATRR